MSVIRALLRRGRGFYVSKQFLVETLLWLCGDFNECVFYLSTQVRYRRI